MAPDLTEEMEVPPLQEDKREDKGNEGSGEDFAPADEGNGTSADKKSSSSESVGKESSKGESVGKESSNGKSDKSSEALSTSEKQNESQDDPLNPSPPR